MKKFDFIDALRGVAVFDVIMSHAQRDVELWGYMGSKATLSPWLHCITAQGARGVQLFFVLSALTLCNSQSQRRTGENTWIDFFSRRFFRIAPMFYAALFFYTIWPSIRGHMAIFGSRDLDRNLY
jgi:peptidoglycan/LPS O-acetylase OafA/YrhL